jgi:hypothetical protein
MAIYDGTVLSEDGQPLADVNVILIAGVNSKTVKTDKKGYFNINIDSAIPVTDVSITFAKSGRTLSTIKNPQPTGEYKTPPSSINPAIGGTLDLTKGYEGGKYLIKSLPQVDQDRLNLELNNTVEFVKKNPNNYSITIKASESKITNYDRETTSPTSGQKLDPGVLAGKRSTILKTYVESFFVKQGVPPPTINIAQKSIEGPGYPPQNPSGSLYKEGSNDYIRISNSYKMYQYTQLIVSLARPTCDWIPNTLSSNIDSKAFVDIIVPPGSKFLYIDADNFPDKITLNNYTIPYYIQNPDALGSKESWGFIVNITAPPTVKRIPVNESILRNTISLDWDKIQAIRDNITSFVLDYTKGKVLKEGETPITKSSPKDILIQEAINIAGSNTVEIKKEIYKYPLEGLTGKITITAQKGNYVGVSVFRFKICNN